MANRRLACRRLAQDRDDLLLGTPTHLHRNHPRLVEAILLDQAVLIIGSMSIGDGAALVLQVVILDSIIHHIQARSCTLGAFSCF